MSILAVVERKIERGERLTEEDALKLYASPELPAIGRLADLANHKKNKDVVFYNVNRHINPTNICALSCKFCAYSRKPGEEGGYAYDIDEMVKKAGEAVAHGATEVHMVGGLHPRWKFDHYKDMIKAVKTAFPQLHIKAFTAVELDWFARRARKTVKQVLEELVEVGLGSLPGGGAEIFHPEIRDVICDTKVSAEQWIDTHRTAHGLGLHSNATMLYGHIEHYVHRVDHMRRLRDLQDETNGFNAFIPLSFQPFQNEMGIDRYTFGYDDLKTLAIARLFLDNFRHVKAYWIMLGQDVAQLALEYGASDLDGTVIEEKISRMAGGRAGMAMNRGFIEQMIARAGRSPVERDTLYNAIGKPLFAAKDRSRENAVKPLIARALEGESLTEVDLVQVARDASLADLAAAAAARSERAGTFPEGSLAPAVVLRLKDLASAADAVNLATERREASLTKYLVAPNLLVLDLAGAHDIDLGRLVGIVWALRHAAPGVDLVVRGLKSLWTLAQVAGADAADLIERLFDAGATSFESSPEESERDMTPTEVTALHAKIHAQGVPTQAKVELDAPALGVSSGATAGSPVWETFVRRVMSLASLSRTSGKLTGLSVEVSPGSFVTAVEYMRAIAIARLAGDGIPTIVAPLEAVPTISPAMGLGTAGHQHPAEKIAALALHHGAGDLGAIDVSRLSPIAIMQTIRAAGLRPLLREAATTPAFLSHLDGLRHVPPLPVAT